MVLVAAGEARRAVEAALGRFGVPQEAATIQADILVEAELRGSPSHGLLRLPHITSRIAAGLIDPVAKGAHRWTGDALLAVDGQQGLGVVVAVEAAEALQARVARTGVAIAAIGNSNHIGMLSWYAERIARAGLASVVLTTSEALVHPWGGYKAMVGTNPIAIGVPVEGGIFSVDLATSVVSMGKIFDHALRDKPIPEGWALDAEGNPTTDPHRAKQGALSPMAGGKGYALGLAIEMLVGALTGAVMGTAVKGTLDASHVANKGDVFIVIDPVAGAGRALSAYLDEVRATPPATGFDSVRVPGDRAHALKAEREVNGIPIADSAWEAVMDLAASPA